MGRRALYSEYDLIQRLDEESAARTERVRQMLIEAGKLDDLVEFDRNMKDIRTGASQARGVWHALSERQRDVLKHMGDGYALKRQAGADRFFISLRSGMTFRACNLPTARNLSRRELIAPDGGAFTPEDRFIITDHGRFVLKHGPTP